MTQDKISEAGFHAKAEIDVAVARAKGQMMQELWDALDLPATTFNLDVAWEAAIDVLRGHAHDKEPYMVGIGSLIIDRGYVMAADKRAAARV